MEKKKNNRGNGLRYIHFAISFGSTTAVSLYLGFLGGQYLDSRFELYPIFTFLGIILGIFLSFKRLLEEIKFIDKPYSERIKAKYRVKDQKEK